MEREKQGFLKLNDSTPLPEHGCVGGGCASHPHSSYRGYPTLPQVIAWPDDGVPRLILTDYSGDLNQIYGTSGWGYAIAGVEVRRIPDALTSIPESLAGITLSELDARLVSLAATGLWMRTAPKDFAELTANAGLRALVPPAIRDRADAWVLDHQE